MRTIRADGQIDRFRESMRLAVGKEINLMEFSAGLGSDTLIHESWVKPELVTAHDFRSYSARSKWR